MLRPYLVLSSSLILLATSFAQVPSRAVLSEHRTAAGDATSSTPDPTVAAGSLRIDRGEGRLPISIPPSEELRFDVEIDLGILGNVGVGKVTLSTGIEEYRPGLPLPGKAQAATDLKSGWLRSYAEGGHLGYDLRHELLTRILPQDWPRLVLQDTQRGSENRRRETKIGVREGRSGSSHRHDSHCGGCDRREHFVSSALPWGSPSHCKGCKRGEHRTWREYKDRAVPEDTVDMLSAVYLARSFLREHESDATFPVIDKAFPIIDKESLWNLLLSRGETKTVESDAGEFRCTEVLLRTEHPPGEPEEDEDFSGLFGISGDLHIWMDSTTGIPVLIQGDLPVGGIMELGIDVRLESYRGTPPAFRPIVDR